MGKKINKIFLLAALLSVGIYSFAWGQGETELGSKSRLAAAGDVIGAWEMTYQVVRASIKSDSLFFADNQYFKFFKDGYVINLTLTKKIDIEDVKVYMDTTPKKTNYRFIANGLLEVNRTQNDFDNIMISVITEDMVGLLQKEAPALKKDDLILSYLDSNKKPYMQRYLRKLNL